MTCIHLVIGYIYDYFTDMNFLNVKLDNNCTMHIGPWLASFTDSWFGKVAIV